MALTPVFVFGVVLGIEVDDIREDGDGLGGICVREGSDGREGGNGREGGDGWECGGGWEVGGGREGLVARAMARM